MSKQIDQTFLGVGTFTGSQLSYYVMDAIDEIEDESWTYFLIKSPDRSAESLWGSIPEFSVLALDGSDSHHGNLILYNPGYFHAIAMPAFQYNCHSQKPSRFCFTSDCNLKANINQGQPTGQGM